MSSGSVYSCGAPLGRAGIGTTALHAADGLARAGLLQRLIVSWHVQRPRGAYSLASLGLAGRALKKLAFYDASGRATDLADAAYDLWASRRLGACRVFHGWALMSLRQMRRARALGALTIVERASAHTLTQAKLLEEEARRWNLPRQLVVARAVRRGLTEYAEADAVFVPSAFAYQSFTDNNFPPDNLVLIPFGINQAQPVPQAQHAGAEFHALFVGLAGVQKGVPDLLAAWQMAGLPNARLSLAGGVSPEMGPIIKERFAGMQGVHWLGFVDDMSALYASVDVLVFPSIQEGSALVTYEAMAHGLPVITTHNAGSVAVDQQHGFIVPIRDPQALAERLQVLAGDRARRRQMGQAARKHVRAYTWQRYGDRVAEAHRRLAGGEKPNGPDWIVADGSQPDG